MRVFLKEILSRYLKSSFFLYLPLLVNALINLISLPIILSSLQIEEYGKWQFVVAMQTWLMSLSASNITSASKRGISRGLGGTFVYAFLARLWLVVPIGVLVLLSAVYFRIKGQFILSGLLTIIGFFILLGYNFQASFYEYLVAKKKFKEWSFWQSLITSSSMLSAAFAAFFTQSVILFALCQMGSIILISWIGWLLLVRREGLLASYRKGQIDRECVSYGLKLIPLDLLSITSGKLAQLIIGPFLGFQTLAIFSVANQLKEKSFTFLRNVRPMVYADFANKDRKKLIKEISPYLIKLSLLGVFFMCFFTIAGALYIKLFLPMKFIEAIPYFTILNIGLPAGMLTIVFHAILESHLRYKELTAIGALSNAFRIALVLFFGYLWGITGICVAIAVCAWLGFILYYLLTIKGESTLAFAKKIVA